MKLKYEQNGENATENTQLEYLQNEKKFIVRSTDSELLEYFTALDLDPEYAPENFNIEFLNNPRSTENSIYTVEIKENHKWERIGWIFPIQALLSREHTQAKNKYFLKYAYVATYILLEKIDIVIEENEDVLPLELLFEKAYNLNINILILDQDNCKAIKDFDLNNYVIGLFQYGYSWTGMIEGVRLLPESIDDRPGHLKLNRISNEITHYEIINMIFKEQLPRQMPDILQFYYAYQIIEILIQEVFENEFRLLLAQVSEDTEALFDVREDVNSISGEKLRVKKLFTKYTKEDDGTSRNELNEECKKFLKYMGRKTGKDVAGNLYAIRCLLVHKMYTISSAKQDNKVNIDMMIKNINTSLLAVLQNMLFSYREERLTLE